jgi:mannose-6-phosphate isomerase-like protein (cupin superfamily)
MHGESSGSGPAGAHFVTRASDDAHLRHRILTSQEAAMNEIHARTAALLAATLAISACSTNEEPDVERAGEGVRMHGYTIDIEHKTLANENFREVLFTGPHLQLVLMTLRPGEEIGMERHEGLDQFLRIEAGIGEAVLDGERVPLKDGVVLVIPSGVEHNVVNRSGDEALRLYSIYTPPEHPDGTVHRTKAEADEYERKRGH